MRHAFLGFLSSVSIPAVNCSDVKTVVHSGFSTQLTLYDQFCQMMTRSPHAVCRNDYCVLGSYPFREPELNGIDCSEKRVDQMTRFFNAPTDPSWKEDLVTECLQGDFSFSDLIQCRAQEVRGGIRSKYHSPWSLDDREYLTLITSVPGLCGVPPGDRFMLMPYPLEINYANPIDPVDEKAVSANEASQIELLSTVGILAPISRSIILPFMRDPYTDSEVILGFPRLRSLL